MVSVEVALRVRPPREGEADGGVLVDAATSPPGVLLTQPTGPPRRFGGFQVALPPRVTQAEAYTAVMPGLVASFLDGFDCTLFAYGQTGSGKTYTLLCPPGGATEEALATAPSGEAPAEWGIVPRALLRCLAAAPPGEAALRARAYEIYMDGAYDLLSARAALQVSGGGAKVRMNTLGSRAMYEKQLKDRAARAAHAADRAAGAAPHPPVAAQGVASLRADAAASFAAVGATSVPLASAVDVVRLIRAVEATRTARAHQLNDRSSRSHCVVEAELRRATGGGRATISRFLFVDLAGSERTRTTGMGEGSVGGAVGPTWLESRVGAEEARSVNTSLSALGRCIRALHAREPFVPFRDSVLTMLLKASLLGAARVCVIATASPEASLAAETVSTLTFATRCIGLADPSGAAGGAGHTRPRRRHSVPAGSARAAAGGGSAPQRREVDLVEDGRAAREELRATWAWMRSAAARGHAGGVSTDADAVTGATFEAARSALAAALAAAGRARQAAREVDARGGERAASLRADLECAWRAADQSADVQRGILARMLHAKAWVEPQASYLARQAEADALLGRARFAAAAADGAVPEPATWPSDVPRADPNLRMQSLIAAVRR